MIRPDAESLIAERRRARIDAVVAARTKDITLVLEAIGDPHNIAAILRSCEAFGVQEVQIIEHEKHGFRLNPKITQGCEKWLDLHFHASIETCAAALAKKGFTLSVLDLSFGAQPYWAMPFQEKLAVVLGNEQNGISERARQLAQRRFMIPMLGFSQSFNVSVTAAICLALWREKRREAGTPGVLDAVESNALRKRFYELAVKQSARIYPED